MSVLTPAFRVSYPNVFKAKRNDFSGNDEFSVMALFDKGEDLSKLKEAAQKATTDKWGADKSKWPTNLKIPFRDQAEKAKDVNGKRILPAGHEEGAFFMNLKSNQRPGVVDQNVEDIIDESIFYAGCYARASVDAYAYDVKGNRGVSFGLGNIQKVKEGEPLGNRSKPEQDFAPVTVESSGSEATTSGDLFS